MQTKEKFNEEIVKRIEIDYLMYLPENYTVSEKWPLVLFLHGAGERGDDIEQVKRHGPPKLVAEGKKFPFILISPQCPAEAWWSDKKENLKILLEHIIENYSIDTDRVYLTGLSMGGFGTWDMAFAYPEVFAALIPICGGVMEYEKDKLAKLIDIPVWVFHGEKDQVVPVEFSKDATRILKDFGGNVELTTYPKAGHDSWSKTYDNPAVYEWMLKQRR